ncbi:MAG: DNA repair protein RecO [Candidatus Omnitrophica bacterium 4484_213]|nr:MAG: DNA repair protein RecO [Candidatus Omnitrophica bacterium 4484_213]
MACSVRLVAWSTVAIQKAEGVVLKRKHFREKSLLLSLYTYQFGKINGILKGKTSIQSPAYVEVVFYPHKKGLHFISECSLKDSFTNLNKSLLALGAANYFSELVDELTFPEQRNRRLFNLLFVAISFLTKEDISGPDIRRFISIFEIKLLGLLGVFPSSGHHFHTWCGSGSILPGTVASLCYLKREDMKKGLLLKISPQINRQIREVLKGLLSLHLQKRLKSEEFLEKISEGYPDTQKATGVRKG